MITALFMADIANAISAISISGVVVKDIDELAASWQSQPNVLYPNPEGFITGFSMEWMTVSQGANAPVDISYTLNYRFLGTEIGDIGNLLKEYTNMTTKLALIIKAMIATPAPYSGKVELSIGAVMVGARVDPAGNGFHGADIALIIKEMH